MTEIAEIYLGNIQENLQLAELVRTKPCLEVSLNNSDRYKGRIHTHTKTNIAVGIIKSRDRSLQSGDVFQTKSNQFLLIQLQTQELLVIDFSAVESSIAPTKLVYLGHVLGNHHYPITIRDRKIYVQLTTDKQIIEKIIQGIQIPGLQINYETLDSDREMIFSTHSH